MRPRSALACALLGIACSDASTRASSSVGSGVATLDGGSDHGSSGDAQGGSESSAASSDDDDDDASDCADACAPAVCIAGSCCDAESACGEICCSDGEVCSFATCVVPGTTCVDASECGTNEYCEYALGEPGEVGGNPMCQGGAALATGRCLPRPPECAPGVEPDLDALDCLPQCEIVPVPSFAPELKFAWDVDNVMMTPIVIQLDDDDCSGHVDERDIPEIVFASFPANAYGTDGTLRALSVQDGALVEKWSVPPGADPLAPGHAMAGGDIDGVPGNEIVTCTFAHRVRAYRADGTQLWQSAVLPDCDQPSIADLDQDGVPEIIVERSVLDGATGALEFSIAGGGMLWWTDKAIAADITGDGRLDVVKPSRAWDSAGQPLVTGAPAGTFPAVADFDLDGAPEVVSIHNTSVAGTHHLRMWRYDANATGGFATIRSGIDINAGLSPTHCPEGLYGRTTGGGPPTIADFDGDGTPDVGVAGGIGYAVFDGDALLDANVANADTVMWARESQDCSSAFTGSSVFDFDGDGSAEVVYADEEMLRIYRGSDGEVLFETCNTSGTLHEYPVIADVDNDGHADIVVVSNNYSYLECPVDQSKQRGLRIFGDTQGRWVRTRRVWNQHAYHVTNVEEDGTIPTVETASWTVDGLNDFRKNVQPEGERSAADLVAKIVIDCAPETWSVVARVRNIGRAAVPAGVAVGFYAGDPSQGGSKLGSGITTKVLYPAEAEDVRLELDAPPPQIQSGELDVFVVVDDGMPDHPWHECRVDNNTTSASGECQVAG